MFGLSLPKILFTIVAVVVIWYGFRAFGNLQARAQNKRSRTKPKARPARNDVQDDQPGMTDVENMIKCPACGDYVSARSASPCGRDDCPYPNR